MSRWEYDTVFYRVFCITLLGVGFTFTVILTNVFVDIDGLLSNKDNIKPTKPPELSRHDLPSLSRMISVNMLPDDKSEETYDDMDYPDSDDLYRSKRSLETLDGILHVTKDTKVKRLLTTHLVELLDELDKENSSKTDKKTPDNEDKYIKSNQQNRKDYDKILEKKKNNNINILDSNKKINDDRSVSIKEYLADNKDETNNIRDEVIKPKKDNKAELLNLAMHNIILQGVTENKDPNELYYKIVDLVKDFEKYDENINDGDVKNLCKTLESFNSRFRLPTIKASNELIADEKISVLGTYKINKTPIVQYKPDNHDAKKNEINKDKDHNVVIKTVIYITANDKSNKENDWNGADKVNGIIKVIYNGNTIKFIRMDNENSTDAKHYYNSDFDYKKIFHMPTLNNIDSEINTDFMKTTLNSNEQIPNYYQKVIYDYLKGYEYKSDNSEHQQLISRKRLKRHVKIRFDNHKTTSKPKTKKDDDELLVEIETHFDSKGTKGEKKKKMIKELIEKIQNAIHSDQNNPTKKKPKHWHIKKRMQSPLSSKSAAVLLNKLILPFQSLAHRHLDPISKAVPMHEDMPYVTNVFDHNHWQRPFYGPPKFFSKFINSAEMNTFDADYNKVMRHNGIPQRLQKPLNTDMSDEIFQESKVYDLGNIKFLMKDIDGSGFSIGFNQYTDEAPDSETMKLFSGLENILQTYHQQYDQENTPNNQQQVVYDSTNKNITPDEIYQNREDIDKSDQHVIQRRSIVESDETEHRANHYRVISGESVLPYKNYKDIFNTEKGQISHVKNTKKSSFLLDENVFEKDLKPAEILSIADFFQRRKRSLKVDKISNIKVKTKINRYLNTKKMASKRLFKNNKKRSKRQIDKIRIIARDLPQQGTSGENMYVESDEKILADRALIREINMPDLNPNDKPQSIEHYDIISPENDNDPYDIEAQAQKTSEDHYDIFTPAHNPYFYENSPFVTSNIFSRRARHNSLMSKYPHIIMEEAPNHAAPFYENADEFARDDTQPTQYNAETTTDPIVPTIIDISALPNAQEINDFIAPPSDNTNYRVSVKIRPKNVTGMSGYKEVHTSINKSYNKNGLMYTSLVNVSQLSKVEKVNKSVPKIKNEEIIKVQDNALKQQQDIIKSMIQQHKHRLDQQLKHLQMERMKLESIDADNNNNNNNDLFGTQQVSNVDNVTETVKTIETTVKPKKGRKPNQDGGKGKRKTKPETTTFKETLNKPIISTLPTTTTKVTTEYVHPTLEDHFKTKMITTIERNEKITNELLKKIDQNTGVLEMFLGKLIQTMDVPSRKLLEESTVIINEPTTTEKTSAPGTKKFGYNRIDRNIAPDSHLPFNFEDYHYMPSMLSRDMPKQANNTLGIPFVYAVRHSYGAAPNKDVASVVYHGHIHTNAINENNVIKRDKVQKRPEIPGILKENSKMEKKNLNSEFWKPKPGEKVIHDFVVNKNSSKFFLDETHNDFKIPLLSNDNTTKAS